MIRRHSYFSLALAALAILPAISGAQTFDRSKPPVLGPPPNVSLPPIITRELPNGLKLMIVEHHELPLASFALVSESGGGCSSVDIDLGEDVADVPIDRFLAQEQFL